MDQNKTHVNAKKKKTCNHRLCGLHLLCSSACSAGHEQGISDNVNVNGKLCCMMVWGQRMITSVSIDWNTDQSPYN